jgi:hypothetical protein
MWIQRETPARRSAATGSDAPAMKPATQAKPWRARTSELPNRSGSMPAAVGDSVMPGIASGVGSGRATDEMTQTTQSRAMATARPPPTQLRNTGHGSWFQRANVPRVWRAPRTSTY